MKSFALKNLAIDLNSLSYNLEVRGITGGNTDGKMYYYHVTLIRNILKIDIY